MVFFLISYSKQITKRFHFKKWTPLIIEIGSRRWWDFPPEECCLMHFKGAN